MHSLHCLRFLKFAHLLNVIHEVTAIHVLHHKIQTVLERGREKEREPSSTTAVGGLAENECGNE